MKKTFVCVVVYFVLLSSGHLQAQVFSVASGTDFNIVAGTVIGADSLDITPTSNFTLDGTSLTHNSSVSNATSFPYIGSVYKFSSTSNPFTGTVQFVYNNSALNSIPTNYLSLDVYNGSSWNQEPVASINTSSTYLQTTGLSGISLNELTLATPPTWTGATSANWNTASNWVSNYVPISTSNPVIPSGVPNNPTVSSSVSINGITIDSGASLTLSDTITLSGNISSIGNGSLSATNGTLVANGTAPQLLNTTILANDTIKNLVVNNSAGVSLSGPLYVTGTITPTAGTLSTGGNLTLVSSASGTARIGQGSGTYLSGNVAIQRYIPAKSGRKYSFIGSPVTENIAEGWQQQIYITGAGTGGTPCGTTSGLGGTTDKYNNNGFDETQTNFPSMSIYNATPVSGSRWVSVPNTTGTNLLPGTGYKINIRGDRNVGSCANELNSANPAPPTEVTLSATGAVTTGTLNVALNDPSVHPYTLIANPYPSQISFTALQASNSSIIYNTMWTYSPTLINGNYTSYQGGTIVNAASGYDNTSGDYLASGQAFFVQAITSGSISFQESHKISGTIPNTNYFGISPAKIIRVALKAQDSSALDEVAVKFASNGSNGYDPRMDAVSFNGGTQVLAALKGSIKVAIGTYTDGLLVDTVKLSVASSTTGNFQLVFGDYASLDSGTSIILHDGFLGTSSDVRANQIYPFNITSDTASSGNNRFELVFTKASPLGVNFISIAAAKNTNGIEVNWGVAQQSIINEYVVERSTNGSSFLPVATTKANYTTANYSIEDAAIPANAQVLYYRVKSIDMDGTITYSKVATIKLTTEDCSLSIYPNPVREMLNISINAIGSNYSISIKTIAGKEVFSKPNVTSAANKIILDANTLSSGVYIVELTKPTGEKLIGKFVKE